MNYSVRISSKRQITIPSKLYASLDLSEGDTLVATHSADQIILQKAASLLDELVGSVKIDDKLKGVSIDEAVTQAKKSYFNRP